MYAIHTVTWKLVGRRKTKWRQRSDASATIDGLELSTCHYRRHGGGALVEGFTNCCVRLTELRGSWGENGDYNVPSYLLDQSRGTSKLTGKAKTKRTGVDALIQPAATPD
jgi:hypothetical protein